MKLTQLDDFVAIVEHGSLRSAARQLGMPQPALTRSVRALEKELGVVLFERQPRGMALTGLGRLFHRRASAVIHEVRRARDELAQSQGQAEGTVVVGLSIMPHIGMLPRVLPQFRSRYPKVRLRVIEGLFPDLEESLRNGAVDVYIGAAPRMAPAPGLVSEILFRNTRAVVCRKGHPLARATRLKDLVGAEWATTSVDYDAAEDLASLFAAHRLAPPQVMYQARSALSLMVGIASTDLLALVPIQWEEFSLTRGVLQVLPLQHRIQAPPIALVRRPDLPLTPAAEHFCDLMKRQVPK